MSCPESPQDESPIDSEVTRRTDEEGDIEVGRETVKFVGAETLIVSKCLNTISDPSGAAVEAGPSDVPRTLGPHAGWREIPGCTCPACGKPAAIHGGIASDFLYQVVLAEVGRRGVEIVCEGCRHRYVFGAAPSFRERTRGDEPDLPVEHT
jgi:hypothetical protein